MTDFLLDSEQQDCRLPNSGWIVATGEGHQDFNGGADVLVINVLAWVDSVTSTKIRVRGTDFPRRVLYAGSWELSTGDSDPLGNPTIAAVVRHNVGFEYEDVPVYYQINHPNSYVHRIGWKLQPGIQLELKVYW